jgi:hypothetical protein
MERAIVAVVQKGSTFVNVVYCNDGTAYEHDTSAGLNAWRQLEAAMPGGAVDIAAEAKKRRPPGHPFATGTQP